MTYLEWLDTVLGAKRRELGHYRNEAGRELQAYWVKVMERLRRVRQQQLKSSQLQSKKRLAQLQWQFPGIEVEKVMYPQHIDGFDLSQLDIREFLNPPTEEEIAAAKELDRLRNASAVRLQARLRAFARQRDLRHARRAATTLQRFHRSAQASLSAEQKRLRGEARQARDMERDMASSVIAFWWEGLLAVRQGKMQEYSARKLQQSFVAYRRRQAARAQRKLMHATRRAAAMVMQRAAKAWLARLHAFQQAQRLTAAIQIQCFRRQRVAQREFRKRQIARTLRRAAGRIQVWWTHLNLNFRWRCTIHFQRVVRSMLARRMVLRKKIALENEDDNDRLSKSYARQVDKPMGGAWRKRMMGEKVLGIISGGGKCATHVIASQRS